MLHFSVVKDQIKIFLYYAFVYVCAHTVSAVKPRKSAPACIEILQVSHTHFGSLTYFLSYYIGNRTNFALRHVYFLKCAVGRFNCRSFHLQRFVSRKFIRIQKNLFLIVVICLRIINTQTMKM